MRTALTLLLLSTFVLTAQASEIPPLYQQACASCHGASGEGMAPGSDHFNSFMVPPADLSEPLFNSREPRADWYQVVKYGGGPMGLSQQMPAYGDALSDEQIDGLVNHIKTFADTSPYPPGDLNFLRAIDTIKAFPEDEVLFLSRVEPVEGGPDVWRSVFYLARRVASRAQWEAKFAHVDEWGRSELDEVELGLKYAFLDRLESEFLLAGGMEVALPVGRDRRSEELIPYLSGAKGIGPSFTFQGTLRSHLPTEDMGEGDLKFSGALHWMRSPWPRGFFPALEGTVTTPFADGEDVSASVIPQLYLGLSRRGHIALSLGAEIPLTDESYDYRMRSFLLWDMADGMPWEGW